MTSFHLSTLEGLAAAREAVTKSTGVAPEEPQTPVQQTAEPGPLTRQEAIEVVRSWVAQDARANLGKETVINEEFRTSKSNFRGKDKTKSIILLKIKTLPASQSEN